MTRRPPADARHEYFVGRGTDPAGDVAAAEEYAVNSLIEEIVRYIGVSVTTDTTAEARASLERFETSVTQEIRQRGSARISGFRVQDRFIERRAGAATVHVLVAYERAALEAEKARIEELFRERQEAVSRPERLARDAEAAGEVFAAISGYIEAAAAAVRSDIDNAGIRFQNNLNAARRLVAALQIEPLSGDLTAMVGESFDEPFRVRVVETPSGRPVGGVPLSVSYREMMPGGRLGVRTARIISDADGLAEFRHPPTTFVGTETLTVSLDMSGMLQELDGVSRAQRPMVDGLRDALLSRRVVMRYHVASHARAVPTGVIVLDSDLVGNPIPDNTTAGGIVTALSRAEFSVRLLPFDSSRLAQVNREQLLAQWRSLFGATVERVIYGVVSIDEFDESDGVMVRVSGTVQAVDLQTGEVLHAISSFQRSRSAAAAGAINAAFRNLGIKMGEEFSSRLR
ncbi:MAG: hypothetical protein EA384_08445 [Spirochaetaceae bacterium]|nr:MAG: hypothetical protein EA384_08445 [Spirochaetaceae bacterium]